HSRKRNFGLAFRPARCKFAKVWGGSFSKQSILNARRGPESANALRDIFFNQPPEVGVSEANGKLTMRSLLILVAICFSATAFAQSAPPKIATNGGFRKSRKSRWEANSLEPTRSRQ